MSQESRQTTFLRKCLHYLSYITVEPTLSLYMFAFLMTSIVEESFFVYKACRVNHGFNKTVCDNIHQPDYNESRAEVQVTVANFLLWNDVAGHGGQIILALFMGAWSDKRGRKWPLLIGMLGKLYYSSMIIVNSLQDTWPVEYVIYTATLPMTITGADVAIFAAAITYLIDVTPPESRTLRVTILEVCYLSSMPLGIAFGKYLFSNVFKQSYTNMFIVNVVIMSAAVMYSLFRLEWRTTANQRPLSEANNLFLDFFDYNHVVNTGKTLCKKRSNQKRTILILLVIMMALYTFQRNERSMMYLYCQSAFNWTFDQYSNFKTWQSALQDVALLVVVPLLSKLWGWSDTMIILVGAGAHSVARIFYAIAKTNWVFYVGGVLAAFGPIVAPVIRSMVSKIILPSEKGKIFSILSAADNAIPIISGVLYSRLYILTNPKHPESIYYLTMASQIGVAIFVLFIHWTYLRQNPREDTPEQDTFEEDSSEEEDVAVQADCHENETVSSKP